MWREITLSAKSDEDARTVRKDRDPSFRTYLRRIRFHSTVAARTVQDRCRARPDGYAAGYLVSSRTYAYCLQEKSESTQISARHVDQPALRLAPLEGSLGARWVPQLRLNVTTCQLYLGPT